MGRDLSSRGCVIIHVYVWLCLYTWPVSCYFHCVITGCLPERDLNELARNAIHDFEARVADLPPELCGAFNREADQLQTELMSLYKTVVLCVRNAGEDLLKI